jgi:DNA-binding Xre family transcriptional regulator
MEYERINIHLKKEIVNDIQKILDYKHARDFLFKKEANYTNIENFIVGCVCYYLRQINGIKDLSGITDLGKPFQLENKLGELLDQKRMSQKELSDLTGIAPSNINNFVKNKNQPSVDYFLRIWIALECPPLEWMFERIPKFDDN